MIDGPARQQPVWDLPIRLFHWGLTGLIAFSWWSAEYKHLDWHIWSGCAVLALLLFRLMWGVVGSSTARFSNFVRGPAAVGDFVRGRWVGSGHSPLGALSVIALLGAIAVQVALGLFAQDDDGLVLGPLSRFVSSDASDRARGLHEIWFYIVLGLIALHLAAIRFFRLARGRKLTRPMITGRAALEPGSEAMRPGKTWVAIICLLIALGITRWVIAGLPPFTP